MARPDLTPWTGEKLTDPTTGEPYPDPVDDPSTQGYTTDLVFVEPDDPRLGTHPKYQVDEGNDLIPGPEVGGGGERGDIIPEPE